MKLAASASRRTQRRPSQPQRPGMFSPDAGPAAFFTPENSRVRAREDAGFFQARAPEEEKPADTLARADDRKEPEPRAETPAAPGPAGEERELKPKREPEEQPVQARTEPEQEEHAQARAAEGGTGAPDREERKPREAGAGHAPPTGAQAAPAPTIGMPQPDARHHPSDTPHLSPPEQTVADAAVARARRLAAHAIGVLEAARTGGPAPAGTRDARALVERWFGRYDPARAARVAEVFRAIAQGLARGDLTLRGHGHPNWYAFVRAGHGPHEVWLCRLFWRKAGDTGYNSRPGTLVHEFAHLAGDDVVDHRYGSSGAADLAGAAPDRALGNADNYACFAESLR